MNLKNLSIAIVFLLGISACSLKKEHRVICDQIDGVKLELPDPKPINMYDVKFFVVTRDNVNELFNMLEESGNEPVFFALTGDGYKALSLNMYEIRRYVLETDKVLFLYREYYEKK